jgi:prepilin peptidase CpaA
VHVSSHAIVLATLFAGAGTAAVVDIARRRIPNAISLATAAAGLMLAATGASGVTLTASIAGFAIGFVLMLPGHVLGATGAGDVKLFAASGAVLGASQIIEASLFVAVIGGVFAVGVAWWRGRLGRTIAQTARLVGRPVQARAAIESPAEHNRFPYGPAIAAGCLLAALF